MNNLIKISEPELLFGYDQKLEDPRDGLALFGPLDKGKPYGIQFGVIGTKEGVNRFTNWVKLLQNPTISSLNNLSHPPFPGFEAVFKIPWNEKPTKFSFDNICNSPHAFLFY